MARLKARWRLLGAVLAAGLLATGAVAAVAAQTSTPVHLAPVATDQLVASALRAIADQRPISGRVTAHIDLGLPSLPTAFAHSQGKRASLREASSLLRPKSNS